MQDNKYNDIDEVSLVFKRLFETTDGQDVLKVLESRFETPALIGNAYDGQAMSNLAFVRIGETNVIKYLKSMINRKVG